jgi:ATP-dependent DNA helicase RecQ
MSNQIQDAEDQLGLTAVTINSSNTDEWESAIQTVTDDQCDLILISPERLANNRFQAEVLDSLLDDIGLFVVDEAHCISDWGHDFRPDYRRIKDIVQRLPADTPVAATTATANNRVVEDVTQQLPNIEPLRGSLVRESLRIQAIDLGDRSKRLAWLAEHLPQRETAGIVYCLTTHDTAIVSSYLQTQGYDARAYHGRLDTDRRRELEQGLLANEMDVVVATNALGMGFNKPDLGFVIHFQRPQNLIQYYQEIGRAGRALDEAEAVLLSGPSDERVVEYFIENSFPTADAFEAVIDAIWQSSDPLYKYEILKRADVSSQGVATCLKTLQIEGVVSRESDGFVTTGKQWEYDEERLQRVTRQRWREFERITEFVHTDECLTRFIDDELDGHLTSDCGYCANCAGDFLPRSVAEETAESALQYYREHGSQELKPRARLPEKHGTYRQLNESERLEPGRTLAMLEGPGWGPLIRRAIEESTTYQDDLVSSSAALITERWEPDPAPEWVTSVPDASGTGQISDFASRLAAELDLPYVNVVRQTRDIRPQAEFENSYHQCWNVLEAFTTTDVVPEGPVLLVDDVIGSRWTVTEVGRTLREAGSGPVFPFALADRRG